MAILKLGGTFSSLIPESTLRTLVTQREIGRVIQDVLIQGVLYPLILKPSLSTFDKRTLRSNQQDGITHLVDIPYEFQGIHGKATITYPEDPTSKAKSWINNLKILPNTTAISLQSETRRLIIGLMAYAQKLQGTESIRKITTSLMPLVEIEKTFGYLNEDGNLYFIYSPKINKSITLDDTQLHASIRSVCVDRGGTMVQYQILSSYEEGKGKNKKIILIAINKNTIDNYNSITTDNNSDDDMVYLSGETEIFTLSVELLRSNISK